MFNVRFFFAKILDKTGMKGTGKWTVQEAAQMSVAAPTISAALDARFISGRKSERIVSSKVLRGPTNVPKKINANEVSNEVPR